MSARTIEEWERRILNALNPACDFETLALELFEFQRVVNPVYGKFVGNFQPSDWAEIPAVPQVAFKRQALRCFPEKETARTFQTSGTTGAGHGLHHFRTLDLYKASILNGWRDLQLPMLPRLILIPDARQVPQSSLSQMMSFLQKLPGEHEQIDGFTLEGGLLFDKIIHFLRKHQDSGEPIMVLGTALAFLHLFERLEEKQLRFSLPNGSYGWETGGYKGTRRELSRESLYQMFEDWLGLPSDKVINEYGMTELTSQFYSLGLGSVHRAPAWLRATVIDPETGKPCELGQTGLLRIYDLANVGSVLAVETQDLAVMEETGFRLIGRDPAALPRGCSRGADQWLEAAG